MIDREIARVALQVAGHINDDGKCETVCADASYFVDWYMREMAKQRENVRAQFAPAASPLDAPK